MWLVNATVECTLDACVWVGENQRFVLGDNPEEIGETAMQVCFGLLWESLGILNGKSNGLTLLVDVSPLTDSERAVLCKLRPADGSAISKSVWQQKVLTAAKVLKRAKP